MKNKQNSSTSWLKITILITIISLSALSLAAAPARNQFEQKPTGASIAAQSAHHGATVSESSAAPKQINALELTGAGFSSSRERVGGHEIAGFSARQGQEENLTAPAG